MNSRTVPFRTYKNFGHKREPIPMFTFLWQGFLTFTFIGMGLEWKRFAKFFFGDEGDQMISPMQSVEDQSKTSEKH